MAPATLADPIFRLRTRDETRSGSLFDVMACAADGTLIDLPSMQAHQHAPVVTALAVMMRAIELYADQPPRDTVEWQAEWSRQVGVEALRLVAPAGERAFFQPPTSGKSAEITIEEVDRLTVAQRHAVKPQRATTLERAVFALMSSDWRQYGGRNRYAGTREGITAVLVGDGRTLASEVKALLVAYSRMKSKAVARGPRQPAMVPVNPPWPPRGLPRPALNSFACRAISHERGGVEMLTLGAPRPSRGKVLVAGRKTIFKNRGVPLLLVVVRA